MKASISGPFYGGNHQVQEDKEIWGSCGISGKFDEVRDFI